MNCASVQIGAGSGRNTTPNDPSTTADSTMYDTAPATPTGEVSTERERHGSGDCDQNLTSRNISGDAGVTGSRWNRIKHRHSRKHARYYYYVRKTHRHPSSREHRRRPDSLASDACDWNAAPRMDTSYYSTGASCAPDAKLNNAESDDFEIGWSDACGIVEGDGEYTIQNVEC